MSPFRPEKVQPASIDLTLGREILVPRRGHTVYRLDLRNTQPDRAFDRETIDSIGYDLAPGAAILGTTHERVTIPADLAARVEGKSSLGRLFLAVHVTAGWIDPGFEGQVTLEIVNLGPFVVTLYRGMPIAQMNVQRLSQAAERPYGQRGNHYQGQTGARAAVGMRGVPSDASMQ